MGDRGQNSWVGSHEFQRENPDVTSVELPWSGLFFTKSADNP